MNAIFRPALVLLLAMTLLTGAVYPLVITAVASAVFPWQANGSLIVRDGTAVGSTLIGQSFSDLKYFWSRPSATSQYPYNAAASSGSNQGPLNPALLDAVKMRIENLRAADPDNRAPIPVDLVTASGSGLDPHISLTAARYQVARVARLRGLDVARLEALLDMHAQRRTFGFFGEPRVNVLELNVALDALK